MIEKNGEMLHKALWGTHMALCRAHTALWGTHTALWDTHTAYAGREQAASPVETRCFASQRDGGYIRLWG
jgi:hypothetical protein